MPWGVQKTRHARCVARAGQRACDQDSVKARQHAVQIRRVTLNQIGLHGSLRHRMANATTSYYLFGSGSSGLGTLTTSIIASYTTSLIALTISGDVVWERLINEWHGLTLGLSGGMEKRWLRPTRCAGRQCSRTVLHRRVDQVQNSCLAALHSKTEMPLHFIFYARLQPRSTLRVDMLTVLTKRNVMRSDSPMAAKRARSVSPPR